MERTFHTVDSSTQSGERVSDYIKTIYQQRAVVCAAVRGARAWRVWVPLATSPRTLHTVSVSLLHSGPLHSLLVSIRNEKCARRAKAKHL
jgi:hypothetical protein